MFFSFCIDHFMGQFGYMVECLFTEQVVMGSNPIATLDMMPAPSKEFLDIQANYRGWIHSETRT